MSGASTEHLAETARPTETKGEARTTASWGRSPSPSRYERLARLLFAPEQDAAPACGTTDRGNVSGPSTVAGVGDNGVRSSQEITS